VGGATQAGTWDRSENVVHQTTGSEKVVSRIPWQRQDIFTCPFFRDPIDISRFHFGAKQKKSGIKLF
jgi:hypothetical protein